MGLTKRIILIILNLVFGVLPAMFVVAFLILIMYDGRGIIVSLFGIGAIAGSIGIFLFLAHLFGIVLGKRGRILTYVLVSIGTFTVLSIAIVAFIDNPRAFERSFSTLNEVLDWLPLDGLLVTGVVDVVATWKLLRAIHN